ncbi:uncharacterized protein PHALS_12492 [Plasmopara halstedii]|uniref:Uncharacterized protein n=1 Tax=Plasmopara halstedii TaxID=4781 RepID=A0A0P1AML9_PLAHL|nr:uncharacterized protein PHALS_12492 [Plasmopara halstedii]CEG42198.1 hypothetical protein PHALS_12492 [Plasmopara halstedii]|eukprot:XP_024578567.1 hypothetical protein PHALS_12492 [Plasmopara halstedii]
MISCMIKEISDTHTRKRQQRSKTYFPSLGRRISPQGQTGAQGLFNSWKASFAAAL